MLAWRQAIAQVFDQPAARADLARLRTVELTVRPSPGGRAAALLLVGWLSSRLGWRLARRTSDGWRLTANGHEVQVVCAPQAAANGLVETVQLTAPTGRYLAHMPSPEDIVVESQSETAPISRVAVRRPTPTRPRLRLDDLLTGGAHYSVFQEAVALARTLASA